MFVSMGGGHEALSEPYQGLCGAIEEMKYEPKVTCADECTRTYSLGNNLQDPSNFVSNFSVP